MTSRSGPHVPPFAAAVRVERRHLVNEIAAGVTLAALCLPLNIGYAEAAGLPPQLGIYATIAPLLVYGFTAGSRRLRIGPDATIAALLAASIGPVAASTGADAVSLAVATALLTGGFLVGFWALRLGALVRYLSKSVLIGFIGGLALEVLLSQIAKILGIRPEAEGWFLEAWELVTSIADASLPSVVVGVSTIVALRLLRRFAPKVPAALVVLVVMTVIVAVVEPEGVAMLGEVPSGLPVPRLPGIPAGAWFDLAGTALAIAVLTIAEGLLMAKRAARRHGEELAANDEIFALGAANVAGALTGSMPSGASASRTAALEAAGARSQLPALVAAGAVIAVVLWFTDLVAQLPAPALAGLVANAVVSTIEVPELRRLLRVRRAEFSIAIGCMLGVLVLGPMPALVVAALATTVEVVRRAEAAPWARLGRPVGGGDLVRFTAEAGDQIPDGLVVVRPGGPLFFATAEQVTEVFTASAADRSIEWLVLDLELVFDIDPTAADALIEGIEEMHAVNKEVGFSRVTRENLRLLEAYGVLEAVGSRAVFTSNRAAEDAFSMRDAPSGTT
jgi:SulP family sulfate permease